ncbi:MAG: sensor histidine kinase [Opitutaceae bacterium]|nr:sensor histidine kinase [Opitutaceae bacterium]
MEAGWTYSLIPMEIEITEVPPLKPGELSLLNMHSLLNILNVLQGETMLIGQELADDPDLLRESLAVCGRVKASFSDTAAALRFAARVREEEQFILNEIAAQSARFPSREASPEIRESLENIRSVFHILEVRAQEILTRASEPGKWIEIPIDRLRMDFQEVFAAIEKNSHGRFRIIYNLALQQSLDYYVDFVVEGARSSIVSLPLLFKDVMRDLIANARKYTAPGGTINVGLCESDKELRFVVQDSGCGIPPDEIQRVVHFGVRGSNVQKVRTMGGGLGLTKAFLVTKQFGGRMWIRSGLGVGTRITITLPRPSEAGAAPYASREVFSLSASSR